MVRVRHRLWANVGASLATVGYSNSHRHSCICLWFRAEAAPFALPSRFRSQPSAPADTIPLSARALRYGPSNGDRNANGP